MNSIKHFLRLYLLLSLVGCTSTQAVSSTPIISPSQVAVTLTSAPTPTSTQTATSIPRTPRDPEPSVTPTPNPLEPYTIEALAARDFGESDILVREVFDFGLPFLTYVIEYVSDGITVTGLLHLPYGEGPFPVIVVLHGYIPVEDYYRGLDTRPLADRYAAQGYAVLMPDYRGYMETAGGPNPLRVPYAIDVLNLIAALDTNDNLDENRVGVIGHSMGGGIATYLMVLSAQVDALVLYGSMNADQAENWHYIGATWAPWWMEQTAAVYGSPQTNARGYAAISPSSYLERVSVPVQIHHGGADEEVPVEWSRELYRALQAHDVDVTYFEYPGAPHTFYGPELQLLYERTQSFFDEHVK